MFPNHSPLKVAEAFRTLEALYPGRIDLGIGRAPGTDQLTAYALRQSQERLQIDDFPEQLAELVAFGNGQFPDDHPFRRVTAMPRDVTLPPIWLLGSSGGYSAQLAATLGAGYAFAYHINPNLNDAIAAFRTYRTHVQAGAEPHTMLGLAVLCAETAERAEELATIMDLSFLRRQRGQLATLPTLEEAKAYPFTELEQAQARSHRDRQVVGDPATVRARLEALVQQTGVDEVMVLTMISSQADRLRSYELLAEAFEL